MRRTVYVPIYSSLYLGRDIKHDMVQLTSTLSVRNVSPRYPVVIESVRLSRTPRKGSPSETCRARGPGKRRICRRGGGYDRRPWCELSREVVGTLGGGRPVDRSGHGGTERQRGDFLHQRRARCHERAAVTPFTALLVCPLVMMAGVTAQQVFCVVAIMMALISFVRTVAYARYIEREGP